jgi:hypothetical protein
MPFEPPFRDRAIERSAELIWRATRLEKLSVDQLDIDAAILDRLGGIGNSTSVRAATSGLLSRRSETNLTINVSPLALSPRLRRRRS